MKQKAFSLITLFVFISFLVVSFPKKVTAVVNPLTKSDPPSSPNHKQDIDAPQQSKSGPIPPFEVIERDRDRAEDNTELVRSEVVLSVPNYYWRHGCGPTALGMVIGYYDSFGFDDLVAGDASSQTESVNQMIASGGDQSSPYPPGTEQHYENYAAPEDTYPNKLTDAYITAGRSPHSDNSLADYMNTSKSTLNNFYGWSWSNDVGPAFMSYVYQQNSEYQPYYQEYRSSYGTMTESILVNEINAGRPMVFLVDSDGNGGTDHFVPVIGYRYNPTLQYAIWDTWYAPIRWENFASIAAGVPWGIWGGWSFSLQKSIPVDYDHSLFLPLIIN